MNYIIKVKTLICFGKHTIILLEDQLIVIEISTVHTLLN